MILADKIIQLRKKNGWSQEDLAEKMNVSRQSVSKWESTQSIPDIDRIIQMSQIFDVSTDYLLKDEIEDVTSNTSDVYEPSEKKHISLEFANEFMKDSITSGRIIGAGTVLCVLSPITLIYLAGLTSLPNPVVTDRMAACIGICVIFVLVAIAVSLFILNGSRMKKYEFLQKSELALDYGVAGIVSDRKKKNERTHTFSTVVGVALCILGVLPLVMTSICGMSKIVIVSCVCLLLAMVAVAVYILIRFGSEYDSFHQLLQEEDYTVPAKAEFRSIDAVSKIYWILAVVIYLGWSFYTGNWRITWVVWPIAGVLFGLVRAIMSLVCKKDLDD